MSLVMTDLFNDILLFDALLCHIWQGHGLRSERAGSVDDLLTVNVFCMCV